MNIYFIGIGGIGVSSLAQYYLEKGNNVYGSDAVDSELIHLLKQKGMNITTGEQKAENLPKDIDFIIYSPSVKEDNKELIEARKRNIKLLTYPEALGEL